MFNSRYYILYAIICRKTTVIMCLYMLWTVEQCYSSIKAISINSSYWFAIIFIPPPPAYTHTPPPYNSSSQPSPHPSPPHTPD